MECPLCESKRTISLDTICGADLEKKYKKLTGFSFRYLLNQDIIRMECENCGLVFFNPLLTGDESFYSSLQQFDWYYMDDKEEYRYAMQYVKETDKVLDVGSGKGALGRLLPTKNYVGLDMSTGARAMAQKNGITIKNETIQDHAEKHQGEYDIVCSFQVLEHVSDPHNFLLAQIKALKKNGILIVAVPSEESYLKYVVNGILNMPPHHVTRWPDKTLYYIGRQFNLEIIAIHHERLRNIHKPGYLSAFIQNCFLNPRLIDDRVIRRVITRGSDLLAKILNKGFYDELLPNGQTVIAVYRKTGSDTVSIHE